MSRYIRYPTPSVRPLKPRHVPVVASALAPAGGPVETIDSGSIRLTLTPRAVSETAQFVDTGSHRLNLTPRAVAEGIQRTDTGSVLLDLQPSGTEFQGKQFTDSANALLDLQPSGTELQAAVDSVSTYLDLKPSGTDTRETGTPYHNRTVELLPILYAKNNEASGTNAKDFSAHQDGTYVNSPTLGVTGLIRDDPDKAVDFASGSSQYIQYPLYSGHRITGDLTILAWLKDDGGASARTIASLRDAGTPLNIPYSVRVASNGTVQFLHADASTSQSVNSSSGLISTGVTTMLVITRTGGNVRIYTQGVLRQTTGQTVTPTADTSKALRVGAQLDGVYWDGILDEVTIFNFALSDAEVLELWELGRPAADFPDTGSVYFDLRPSGTDTEQAVETASILLDLQPSGTDTYTPGAGGANYTDSGNILLDLQPSGTEFPAKQYTDTANVLLDLQPTGTDTKQSVDTGNLYFDLVPSGSEYFGIFQYGRPNADISAGGWTTTPLAPKIVSDDGDYIEAPSAGGTAQVRLSAMNVPSADTNHRVRYRYGKDAAGTQVNLTVRLKTADGSTTIASQTHTDIPAYAQTGVLLLTSGEAASIPDADYVTGLILEFQAVAV